MTAGKGPAGEKLQIRFSHLLVTILFLCSIYTLFQFVHACMLHDHEVCQPMEDFIAFYTEGLRAVARNIPKIYDVQSADAMLESGKAGTFLPLLYPPQGLIFLSVLGFFSYYGAFILWYCVPLAMLLICLRTEYIKDVLENLSFCPILIILFPFLMVAFLAGQNGMLWEAVMIMVLMWRNTKPLLAGCMLALFSIKPHLGIFIPLLLLFEQNWKVLITAIVVTLAMAALSTLIWGMDLWNYYIRLLQTFAQIEKITPQEYILPGANPFMAFRMIGLGTGVAFALQLVTSLTALIFAWQGFKHCKTDAQRIFLICTGGLLFSTYSYIYDDIMLALPCMILYARASQGKAGAPERIAFLLMAFIPVIAIRLHHLHIPYSFIAILFAFVTTTLLLRKNDNAVLPA